SVYTACDLRLPGTLAGSCWPEREDVMRRLPFVSLWAAVPAAMLAALISLLSLAGSASTQETCPPSHATGNIIVGMASGASGASAESLERMKDLNGEGGEKNFF
ncbi:MAG: hypothetical protein M3533_04920, partial [Actinomycetota bacterium]|nr:hypothetical protein [Actinomycetota bacterium]